MVVERRPTRLECDVAGVPEPTLTWTKNGETLEEDGERLKVTRAGRILQIAAAEVADTGVYACTATNVAGQDQRVYRLQVTVPPLIDGSQVVEELSVTIGNSVTMDCPATGLPEPTIRWTREGGEAFSFMFEPNVRIQEGGRKLVVFNAQLLDLGGYTCTASNQAGNISKDFVLNVLGRAYTSANSTRIFLFGGLCRIVLGDLLID